MKLNADIEKLREVMKAFYTLTQMRITFFDGEYNELLAYPEKHGALCSIMKSNTPSLEMCSRSDRRSFEECKKRGELIMYTCHAGLTEAIIPIKDNGIIISYLMFGQVANSKSRKQLIEHILPLCTGYSIPTAEAVEAIDKVPFKSDNQLLAAAKILETCTSYILFKEMITSESSKILSEADRYIQEHLSEELTPEILCAALQISRSKLYRIFENELQTGVSSYIKRKRMDAARDLLKKTKLPVSEIAQRVGFSDYNYFSRVYKQTFGKSAKSYRKA